MWYNTVIISIQEARDRDFDVRIPRSTCERGDLMTGYGILLTFGSRIRYTRTQNVSTCRIADVSSHPRSPRFKYQTRAQEAQRYNARVMCKPRLTRRVNRNHRFSQYPSPFTHSHSKPIIADLIHRGTRRFKISCQHSRVRAGNIISLCNVSMIFENLV